MAEYLRCPACGMLVRRKRFNQDWPFEVVWQECVGKGKGGFKWTKPRVSGMSVLRLALKAKLKRLLATLEMQELIRESGYEKMEPSASGIVLPSSQVRMEHSTLQLSLIPAENKQAESSLSTWSRRLEKASVLLSQPRT